MKFQTYYRPASLDGLYRGLQTETAKALFIAGATDIIVQDRGIDRFKGLAAHDLTAIPELREISEDGNDLMIGSTVTHARLAASELVESYAPVLGRAAAEIGACQLRNRATIGGNVANASPAADTLGPLAALDALVVLDYLGEIREVPVTEFITAPGKTVLRGKEFIRAFRVRKLDPNAVSRFYKVGRRNAMAISRLTLSLVAVFDRSCLVTELRVAVGASFPRPMRFYDAEAAALGHKLDDDTIMRLSEAFSNKLPEIAGRRASTEYKQPVCRLACRRLLTEMRDEYEARIDQLPPER